LYLFVLPYDASDKGEINTTNGDMPLESQFGYLFPGASERTIAHEAGHGAFNLEHPFDRPLRNSFSKGDLADNLMDYSQETELAKIQWDATRNPGHVFGLFQKDKDGMSAISEKGIVIKEERTFVAPNNSLVKLPENAEILYYCPQDEDVIKNYGYLYKFKIGNKVWIGDIKIYSPTGGFTFGGYKSGNETYTTSGTIKAGDEVWKVTQGIIYGEDNTTIKSRTLSVQKVSVKALGYPNYYDNVEALTQEEKVIAITSCDNTSPYERLLTNLKAIAANTRSNQDIELEYWDNALNKFRYFTTENNKLVEIEKPLSDIQIETGEWTGGKETKIRYTVNQKGIVQVKSFGFRNDLQLAAGKEETRKGLPEIAKHITEQTNKFLLENNVTDFSKTAKFTNPNETFADEQGINIEGAFTKIISEGIGVTVNLLKTGEIEEKVYLVNTQETSAIKASGMVTGSFEVIAQKVTDLTSLGTLVYDVAVDKQVRSEICKQFIGIKNQIEEDPGTFFPVMGEILLTVTTNNTSSDWQTIWDEKADTGKRSHLVTRGTGSAIVTVMSGAALVKNLPEIGDKLTDWVKKTAKSRGEIRKVLTTDAGQVYLKKYFDKVVKQGSFEEWFNKAKEFKLGKNLNFEVHHIFPVNVLENNQELQRILNKFGFDFNGVDNAIPLQKKSLKWDQAGHANHPQYDIFIGNEIDKILTRGDLTDLEKFEEIKKLIGKTKNKLETDVLLGNKNMNDIINW
jgi:hypothetical protein